MRILYLSQYFPPEAGATQTRAYEMSSNLVHFGHNVTVITEFPNHPSGIMKPEYRGKLFQRKNENGIHVIRIWVKASPNKTFFNRILFYFSYMINATLAGLFLTRGHYDLIFATSPPLFVGAVALILNRLKRIPFVFEVRDLWPESAIALGEISNKRLISWLTWLEEKCYNQANKIVVVTNGIREVLLKRGINSRKIALIPNGANVEMFQYRPDARIRIRQELKLENKFVAIYAGIFGIAQGLDVIVKAGEILANQKDIHFILIGDGPKRKAIEDLITKRKIGNITMLPEQPRSIIPDYLSTSDAAIIPLRNIDLFKGALPSKMFDAWACERPIILSVPGEAKSLLEKSGGGIFIPPENPTELANAILKLKNSPTECKKMGKMGREFTRSHFSRRELAKLLTQTLEESINH